LAVGLISGVVLNLIHRRQAGGIAWTDPVVLSSGVLFLWLLAVVAFEWVYKPARAGHKVAYLTVASFVFLGLVLYFVLFFAHATQPANAVGHVQIDQRRLDQPQGASPRFEPWYRLKPGTSALRLICPPWRECCDAEVLYVAKFSGGGR
jgi:hypothetical protein